MSELLTALVAAAKVGFDAPECPDCKGHGEFEVPDGEGWYQCPACDATGLDASDPFGLIGRAESWLLARDNHPGLQSYPLSVHFELHNDAVAMIELVESHDKTAGSRATALLRLVARVGGAA